MCLCKKGLKNKKENICEKLSFCMPRDGCQVTGRNCNFIFQALPRVFGWGIPGVPILESANQKKYIVEKIQ